MAWPSLACRSVSSSWEGLLSSYPVLRLLIIAEEPQSANQRAEAARQLDRPTREKDTKPEVNSFSERSNQTDEPSPSQNRTRRKGQTRKSARRRRRKRLPTRLRHALWPDQTQLDRLLGPQTVHFLDIPLPPSVLFLCSLHSFEPPFHQLPLLTTCLTPDLSSPEYQRPPDRLSRAVETEFQKPRTSGEQRARGAFEAEKTATGTQNSPKKGDDFD